MINRINKIILVVLDGLGVASAAPSNAVSEAKPETLDSLVNNYPCLTLQAAGPNVGLAWGEPGNSEVGHMCLGAGRIILQDSPRIDRDIAAGGFYKNPAFLKAIDHVKKNNSRLHIMGLIGNGGVHASQYHLYSLLTLATGSGLQEIILHCITDGRDTAPNQALLSLKELEKKIMQLGKVRIASVMGRFYAMDRAKHWDLTQKACEALVLGKGVIADSPMAAIENFYAQSIYDEVIPPTLIAQKGETPSTIRPGDAMIISNFRADRVIQITQALTDPASTGMAGEFTKIENFLVATMTQYSKNLNALAAYPKIFVKKCLSEVLSGENKKQAHLSEMEKFPHVTFFFSVGREDPYAGEQWEKVSSHTSYQDLYENVPQMAAFELTNKFLQRFGEPFDFYLINYANPDMVGHTGSIPASIKAVQAVDQCIKQLTERVLKTEGVAMFITADHGNVEGIRNANTGRMEKNHSTNPVPFILVAKGLELPRPRKAGYEYLATQVPDGQLCDVAPTILEAYGIPKPSEMTGISLLPQLLDQIKK